MTPPMRFSGSDCCARAKSGAGTAAPIVAINSRRLTSPPYRRCDGNLAALNPRYSITPASAWCAKRHHWISATAQ